MKKRNTIAAVLLIAVSFSANKPLLGAETGATPLTLDEALRMTREHNPKARQATEEVKAADAKVTESRSAWFPQISGKAGYHYLDPVSEISFGGTAMKFIPNDNYDAHITAEMMLFDFGRTASTVDMAKAGRNSAVIRQDMTLRDLSLATVQTFYSVLFLQEAVKVQEKEVTALQTNLDHMQKRYDQGAATRFDLLTTQVRLASAANRKIDYENKLRNQEITLRR
ncbi:MAG: TolC family protein, partial [Chlorobaculum sp.]